MDIRRETALIIRRDGRFLVGRIMGTSELKWSTSPYDAWRTRIRAEAKSVQAKTGGEIMLFNPVAGQLREADL